MQQTRSRSHSAPLPPPACVAQTRTPAWRWAAPTALGSAGSGQQSRDRPEPPLQRAKRRGVRQEALSVSANSEGDTRGPQVHGTGCQELRSDGEEPARCRCAASAPAVGRSAGSKARRRHSRRSAPLSALAKCCSNGTPGFLRMFIRKRRAFSLRTCAGGEEGKEGGVSRGAPRRHRAPAPAAHRGQRTLPAGLSACQSIHF